MISLASLSLALALVGAPPEPSPQPVLATAPEPERRARRFFIAGGALMGVSFMGELAGTIVALNCHPPAECTLATGFVWGSTDAGTRYALTSAGPGSAYVLARTLALPLVWTEKGLLVAGAHAQAIADARAGVDPAPKRVAWALFGSGTSLWAASRLARFAFLLTGVCQDPRCAYGFDQMTLGVSRGLLFPGSALLMHRRTHARVQLGISPMGSYGLALTGQF